jgi:RNA polymerase sigma-70 factor (ECF subfamily)
VVNATVLRDVSLVSERDRLYREAIATLSSALSRVAAGYEADRELRRDLLQEIHAALWKSLETFDRRCSLKTWSWRVAHNVGATHLGRQRSARFVALDEVTVQVDRDVDGQLDRAQLLSRLMTLVHALAPADRTLVLLYLEGLSAAAISDVTGLSASNVATRLHRLKATLARTVREGSPS